MREWDRMVENLKHLNKQVRIALVGKYIDLHDSYLSVAEALKHGGFACDADVHIDWVDSEQIMDDAAARELLGAADGIIVPGGFGSRGIDGMIRAAKYAREHKVPYFGICLGLQIAIIEFARDVLGMADANSTEMDPDTQHPLIDIMPDQKGVDMGGTMRLGQYPCTLQEGTRAYQAYGQQLIYERHRHRYEVNNDYREELENAGMMLCGVSPDKHIVEMVELKDHPWFVASQAHPEFKSRPNRPHPLFAGFIRASLERKEGKK